MPRDFSERLDVDPTTLDLKDKEVQRVLNEHLEVQAVLTIGGGLRFEPGTAGVLEAVTEHFEAFCGYSSPRLTWFYEARGRKYRRFEPKLVEVPRTQLLSPRAQAKPAKQVYWTATSGRWPLDASACSYLSSLWPAEPYPPPAVVLLGNDDPAARAPMVESTLALARKAKVRTGELGYVVRTTSMEWYRGDCMPGIFALCARYQGAGYVDDMEVKDGLWGVNWITFVPDELLAKVGGVGTLKRKLSSEFVFHEVLEGVAIQAGPEPLAGDVNASEALPLYHELGRLLAPIRDRLVKKLGRYDRLKNAFNPAETQTWLARFDT